MAEPFASLAMTHSQKRFKSDLHVNEQKKRLDTLFEQHWERVWAIAYRLVGDQDEAEDLALEAFIKLYQNPPTHTDNIAGWLYRVTSRLGLNALRSKSRKEHYEGLAQAPFVLNTLDNSPEKMYETRIEKERVRHVLGQMKTRSAQILILRSEGLSYAEISESLEISPGSVGTLLTRAQREFEKKWREMDRL